MPTHPDPAAATPLCDHPACNRPVDGVRLCPGCTRALRDHLLDLAGDPDPDREGPVFDDDGDRVALDAGLIADLQVTMTRQDVAEPDTARPATLAGTDDDPLPTDEPIAAHPHPLHHGAATLLDQIGRTMRPWVAVVAWARYGAELAGQHRDREQRAAGMLGPWRPPLPFRLPHGDPRDIAGWLALYPNVLAGQPGVGRFAAAVARQVVRAREVVVPRPAVYLGWCVPCWERPPTGQDGVLIDLYAAADDERVSCPRCGSSWPVADRRAQLLAAAAEQWDTAPAIERALVDYVRDVYTEVRPDGSRVLSEDYRPMTTSAIHGYGDRGRLQRVAPTTAEVAAAKAERRPKPQPRYLVGEVMGLVRELRAEKVARAERARSRGRGRRTPSRIPAGTVC